LKEFSHIYIGILNDYDLIASKLTRGATVDFEDCVMLVRAHKDEIDIARVEQHCKKIASFDIAEKRITGQVDHFLNLLRKENLHG